MLAVSLGLGLLVGLQRERTRPRLAGIRTYALITVLGTLSALLGLHFGGWVVAAALVGVAAAVAMGNALALRTESGNPGITSEIAILVMFGVGAYLAVGPREVAVAIGATVAIVLHAKPMLHGLAQRMGDRDMHAIMQFALISLIVLPALPDRGFGPWTVLNPHNIWLMVVLVVGISLVGYVAYKALGTGGGLLLAGVLGGLVSSTATTVSAARRAAGAANGPSASHAAAAVILLASTVVYGRLLVEIGAVAPQFLPRAAGPLAVMAGVSAATAAALWLGARRHGAELPPPSNPTELRSALVFGGIYAAVLLAAAAARQWIGPQGLFAVALVSGLTDMDAITLSVSRMTAGTAAGADGLPPLDMALAWRAIVVAVMSNLLFKGAIAAALGGRALGGRVAALFGMQVAAGVALVLVWPR